MDVVNRGLSGWNTNNVLTYLNKLIPQKTTSSPELKYLVISNKSQIELTANIDRLFFSAQMTQSCR